MAGSITDNAAIYKKTFTYVPPTPPSELIDSTNYTLNFVKRKFIHIGIDPTDMFRVAVHIITPSRYVKISTEFLKRIFSLMGNILSFILEQPAKYKRTIFLETENFKLFSMMYSGENSLVIESKIHDGCRILLNRMELIRLHYLEWCIFETIVRKSTIMHPIVLKQFNIFTNYINGELSKAESLPRTSEEMTTFIKNVRDDHIIASSPKHDVNFISQLKMNALAQLTEHCMQQWNGEMSPKPFDDNLTIISPTSPTYLPSSITKGDTFDIHNEKVNSAKPYYSFDGMLSFDENDGPDFFNIQTVSDGNQATYAMFPRPL
ncbi:uncharacterized protein LOC112595592 isoform X1 [Melanaphis sacchari]|uniref:uncharacterized protein LOC112595592 isoform X1 n=1 Tax=Melanaphis sacchari TaxID=742174 RepID=UPI000DC147CA|nr:uncharacterized protein LOC112595592 isoform X1 [Melanaphis sacchari]XP_025196642.1 uncharacterized protein LOC112595592 isoform X1 [Melanaphis sacchari]